MSDQQQSPMAVTYDCPNRCTYPLPVASEAELRAWAEMDTVGMWADAQHERECPSRRDVDPHAAQVAEILAGAGERRNPYPRDDDPERLRARVDALRSS
ncbi:hypothetical protein O7626_40515 [Micromonospora sp. WMMD1102]|uniref:hypothetical protein n=1 Tax=Micromonospora sp. WMMD1102 TaxID=3016105 RepID=UPI0024155200|nr:hypothetical protein [Micromonospora sp. WMMD1102]MDG4792101.1 hypothetical protein [Micromonospora sp. WMMD1102]